MRHVLYVKTTNTSIAPKNSSRISTPLTRKVEIVKYQHPEGSVSNYSLALSSASLTDLGTRDSTWRSLVSPSLNSGLPDQRVGLDIVQVRLFACFFETPARRRVPFGCLTGDNRKRHKTRKHVSKVKARESTRRDSFVGHNRCGRKHVLEVLYDQALLHEKAHCVLFVLTSNNLSHGCVFLYGLR